MQADWLFVGLGNPGARYENTRHNIGWMVCVSLCEKYKAVFISGKGQFLQAILTIGKNKIIVVLPTTYMNNSGEAVAEIQRLFHFPAKRIVVVVDEYNFPVGKIQLKDQGSDGGHNGLTSLISHLKTENFLRLRCGIDRKFGPGELVDYVLAPFSANEETTKQEMISQAVQALETLVNIEMSRAMSIINSQKKKPAI